MVLTNSFAILLFGILSGIATSLNFIGSQSYLLSVLRPLDALYVTTVSGVAFVVFLRYFGRYQGRFATFSLVSTAVLTVCMALLLIPAIPPVVRAAAWFFMAMNAIAFFRWVVSEFTCLYLDPARTKGYFAYIVTTDEIGILLAALLIKVCGQHFGFSFTILLSVAFYAAAFALIAVHFASPLNLEIRYSGKGDEDPSRKDDEKLLNRFVFLLLMLCITLGAYRVCEEYIVRVALKESLGSFEAISNMTANYMMISSFAIIIISTLLGRVIRSRHLSPVFMTNVHIVASLAAAVACFLVGSLAFFVGFEIVKRTFERCFHIPSRQMIISCYVRRFRNRLRTVQNLYYYTVIPIPFAILFTFPAINANPHQKQIVLGIIIASLVLSLFLSREFRKSFQETLCQLAGSLNKTSAVLAIQALSYLRPRRYERFLIDLLKSSPKKILRKNVILSLAYAHDSRVDDVIIREFNSEKEEIQLAVLDALKVSRSYKAVQFMINIVKVLERPKSLRVRMNATSIVAGMYGRLAIPFLLDGLKDPDARVKANTLETLSLYQDRKLAPYFREFANHPVPRVKANAFLGLSYFRRHRREYRDAMAASLREPDPKMVASALYVVGKRRDRFFVRQLLELFGSSWRDEVVKENLAWALLRVGRAAEGYELFDELFREKMPEGGEPMILHHFSQMDLEMRFDILKHMAMRHWADAELVELVCGRLKRSKFDFHQELEYFQASVDRAAKAHGVSRGEGRV